MPVLMMSPLLTFQKHKHMGGAAVRERMKINIAGHKMIAMVRCLLDVRLCSNLKNKTIPEIQRYCIVKIKCPEHLTVLDINNYSHTLQTLEYLTIYNSSDKNRWIILHTDHNTPTVF